MRTLVLTVLACAPLVMGLGAHVQAQSLLTFSAGRCMTDDEVPANERSLYEKSAMRFVEILLGDKPEAAYLELADELRARISKDDFIRSLDLAIRPFRPFADLHVEHSYRETQTSLGSGLSKVPCTTVAHGDVSTPEGRVMITVMPVKVQAHVIIEGKAKNNRWAFVLWLAPAQPYWTVYGFRILAITILDRTATDLWKLAHQEQQRGHALNSYLLYVTAAQLAYRGPDLEFGTYPEIVKDMTAFGAPAELKGKPPFEWKLSNGTYHVLKAGPIGVGRAFDLLIQHQVAQTDDHQELERQNRAFIEAFTLAHPEYTTVFDGLVIQAAMPNGMIFGTVQQTRNGQ